jgi:hypothetical protein
MIKTTLRTNSREQFLAASKQLGRILQNVSQQKPEIIIDLNGDACSGKSLVAIAIDSVFRPHNYTNSGAIAPYCEADNSLAPGDDKPVVFYNFNFSAISFKERQLLNLKENYDEELKKIRRRSPSAKILIAANLYRGDAAPYFNYIQHRLNSDVLDLVINVRCLQPSATETLTETARRKMAADPFNYAREMREKFHRDINLFTEDHNPLAQYLYQLDQADMPRLDLAEN